MAKRPITRTEESSEPMFTSLLDVILLLISFFVITVNFVQTEQINESIKLPPAQSAIPMDKSADNWVFLNMDHEGKLVGSNKDINLESPEKLKLFLQRQKEHLDEVFRQQGKTGNLDIVLILRADKDARYRDIWNALEICGTAGYKKWQLRVVQKQV